MGVMKNTLENLPEILQKGSRNIRRPLPLYLTTVTPQVTISTSRGKYHLPHIWDEVLHKTSELKLKN